eukprot:TRINITY_DN12505_c0_g1_i1.p1 TRINITY_DN12505_c0_g1~~TRINITY_DN12505_c0_g1_i1.p1  ORF type:complete len:422 (+),score=60.62 TRINITY_DN12505_c0_g1_i1:193-1458(+)
MSKKRKHKRKQRRAPKKKDRDQLILSIDLILAKLKQNADQIVLEVLQHWSNNYIRFCNLQFVRDCLFDIENDSDVALEKLEEYIWCLRFLSNSTLPYCWRKWWATKTMVSVCPVTDLLQIEDNDYVPINFHGVHDCLLEFYGADDVAYVSQYAKIVMLSLGDQKIVLDQFQMVDNQDLKQELSLALRLRQKHPNLSEMIFLKLTWSIDPFIEAQAWYYLGCMFSNNIKKSMNCYRRGAYVYKRIGIQPYNTYSWRCVYALAKYYSSTSLSKSRNYLYSIKSESAEACYMLGNLVLSRTIGQVERIQNNLLETLDYFEQCIALSSPGKIRDKALSKKMHLTKNGVGKKDYTMFIQSVAEEIESTMSYYVSGVSVFDSGSGLQADSKDTSSIDTSSGVSGADSGISLESKPSSSISEDSLSGF